MKTPNKNMAYLRILIVTLFAHGYSVSAVTPAQPKDWNAIGERLRKGDYAVLDELKEANRMNDLYRLLNDARWKSLGENSAHIGEAVKARIRSMPEHAVYRADQVEELTGAKGNSRRRELILISLQEVATAEAVAQLGRFIYDERNPDYEDWHPESGTRPPSANYRVAAWSIMMILKPEMKWEMRGGFDPLRDVPKVREWWESEAGEPYRNLLAASGRTVYRPPQPPDGGSSTAMPPVSLERQTKPLPESPAKLIDEIPGGAWGQFGRWWGWLLGLLAAAAAAWGLQRLKRKRE